MVTLQALRSTRRDDILRLAEQRGARNLRVFGSVARGEANNDSDLDLLVEWDQDRSLLDHAGLVVDAVIRNAEVIGEAAKRVSPEAHGRLAQLEWKAICGMRDVLIHDYIGVDLEEVWNVAASRIPELQAILEPHLSGYRSTETRAVGSLNSGAQQDIRQRTRRRV